MNSELRSQEVAPARVGDEGVPAEPHDWRLIRAILVPTDFSEPSQKALEYAVALAGDRSAVHLIHVVEPSCRFSGLDALPTVLDDASVVEECRRRLEQLAQQSVKEGRSPQIMASLGSPALEIEAAAHRIDADLIVLSTHGRSGLNHLIMGSVAEAVIRRGPCPILVVRKYERDFALPPAKSGLPLDLRKILVTIDFTPASVKVVHYARKFAAQHGGRITLIHSIPFPPLLKRAKGEVRDPREFNAERMEKARERLLKLGDELLPAELRSEPAVCVGPPAGQIPDYASMEGFDLVICGSGGHSELHHAFLGSTAEGFVRHSACPVLVVRNPRSLTETGRD